MKMNQLVPELLVEDMKKTLGFYRDILGFKPEIVFPEKKPIFAQVGKDEIHIMFYLRNDFQKEIPKLKRIKMGGSILLYFKVEKIKDFYQKIKDRVTIIQSLRKMDYGGIEFTMEDCNGYLLAFSQRD